LLVQCRADGVHVLPALPCGWKNLEFDGLRTAGAFLVGTTVAGGRTRAIRVQSLRGGWLDLHYPGGQLRKNFKAGERLTIRPE
jgi:hypothetical protein